VIVKYWNIRRYTPIGAAGALIAVHVIDARGPTAPASIAGKAPVMTAAQVPSLGRPPRRTTRQAGALAAGIALVLLVAAGLLLWQLTRGDEATTPTEAEITTPAAPAGAARDQPASTIYLVADQAQADALQQGINEGDVFRAALGDAPVAASVLLFPSLEAEVQFWSAMGEQERAGQGLTSVTVVDLRAPVPPAVVPDALTHARNALPAAVSDQEMYERAQLAPATTSAVSEDVAPRGGLAELYAEQAAAAPQGDLRTSAAGASGACGTTAAPAAC
jgi:hypothetical protein